MTPSQVKDYRTTHNLTQKSLSVLLGCSKRTVEGWEAGIIKKFSNMAQKMWDELLSKDSLKVIAEYDKKFGPKDRTIHKLLKGESEHE